MTKKILECKVTPENRKLINDNIKIIFDVVNNNPWFVNLWREYNIPPYYKVGIFNKVFADIYVDDKAANSIDVFLSTEVTTELQPSELSLRSKFVCPECFDTQFRDRPNRDGTTLRFCSGVDCCFNWNSFRDDELLK